MQTKANLNEFRSVSTDTNKTVEPPVYKKFLLRLNFHKNRGRIKILKRGVSKDFAFRNFNLDTKFNTIEQFAEMLFYYGEKSKYFWEHELGRDFGLNDVSDTVFSYIFGLLNEIANKEKVNHGTEKYRKRNRANFKYFSVFSNQDDFQARISKHLSEDRRQIRNYYFRIIHQLGETKYKGQSMNISGTGDSHIAEKFSRGEIVINFWDFDFNAPLESTYIPKFLGKPYKSQKEISIFGAIFPHYIYSFIHNKKTYFNPAFFGSINLDDTILNGFIIDQSEFKSRIKKETAYEKGINLHQGKFEEID